MGVVAKSGHGEVNAPNWFQHSVKFSSKVAGHFSGMDTNIRQKGCWKTLLPCPDLCRTHGYGHCPTWPLRVTIGRYRSRHRGCNQGFQSYHAQAKISKIRAQAWNREQRSAGNFNQIDGWHGLFPSQSVMVGGNGHGRHAQQAFGSLFPSRLG